MYSRGKKLITFYFFLEIMEVKRERSEISKVVRGKKNARVLCPTKLAFKSEEQIILCNSENNQENLPVVMPYKKY